jgi:hypothetical protein
LGVGSILVVSNILPLEKQVNVVSMLAEGASIRGIERMTGVHRDTVMRLGARVGNACSDFMDGRLREGDVEVFDLISHAKAKRCHAWPTTWKKGAGRWPSWSYRQSSRQLPPSGLLSRLEDQQTREYKQRKRQDDQTNRKPFKVFG